MRPAAHAARPLASAAAGSEDFGFGDVKGLQGLCLGVGG